MPKRDRPLLRQSKGRIVNVYVAALSAQFCAREGYWFPRLLAGHELCHIPLNGLNSSSHAYSIYSLEAMSCVPNNMPLGLPLFSFLTNLTLNDVATLKMFSGWPSGRRMLVSILDVKVCIGRIHRLLAAGNGDVGC
jgi:hypothetical protein